MQKAIETSNGLKGGLLKGKAHYDSNGNPLGGIKAVVTDQGGKPIEVEGNEVIINKKTVQSERVLTIKGTPKEILSTLNQMDGNGVAIGDEEAEILAKYRTGGKVGESESDETPLTVKKYILNRHPKKEDIFQGGKVDGYKIVKIRKLKKHYGIIYEILLLNTNQNADGKFDKRIISYSPERKRIGDFEQSFLTTTKGKYYTGWNDADVDNEYRTGGKIPSDINKLSLNEFEKYLEEKYNSKVELGDYKKYIYLSRIEVDKETRGLGIGSEIMSEIIDYADYNDKKITLTPSTDYGASSVARLKDFYKKFGFVENKGRNKDFEISQLMYRVPKVNKYHLGGDMSKHLAPNGKPSNLNHEQWHLVRTSEFKAWFGDWENDPENSSKVVDENGEPLVVYHGTTQKFNSFDKEKQNLATGFGDFGAGFYFTSSFNTARYYTLKSEKDRIIMNVFLNIKKPFIVELNWEKLSDESIYNYKKIKGIQGYQRDIINDSFKEDRPSKYITKNIGDFIFQDILIVNGYDGVFVNRINIHKEKNVNQEDEILYLHEIVAFEPNQIKLADGTNTTFDANNDDIRFAEGGSISKMTPSELKEFYASPEGKKLDAQTYSEWNKLVNMTKSELEKFYNSVEGKEAGLTTSQAKEQGIDSGRESARWVLKMKDIPYKEWSSDMWRWAKKQINFIKRMTGMKGSLYNGKGEKTRKHTALLIWGHNPEQKFKGGGDVKGYDNLKNPILINGFISNKEIDGKEIFLITYNSGGQEGLNVHQTMNPLAMLDAVEKKTGLHTNTLQVFIYEHTENSNRIETEDELEFLKNNYTVIIVDRDSVEFYNGLNPEQKFAQGGGIEGEFELELYQVRFDTDDDSEIKLVTTSYEDAKSEYEGATIGDFGDSEFNVSLEKKIDKYKFVYELDEDESIDDYPIEEYYDDSYYYELIEEGEFDNIENRVVTAFNSSSEDLLDEVQEWAKDKFGNYKYNTIDVYSEDDTNEENDSIGSIQLRIADHSQNESNLPYGIDRSLSVVIANKDATRGRFQQNRPQIYFDGNDSFDYVISEIENYIEDAKEYIQSKKFEKGGRLRKFRGGGELSQKALAVETNDLTDFVRKYFIKDGRIDVSDAMQELFGNKRGKSIADEYRKRIGLHKKGGLTISQLAHNLWEQHRDEVREDIDDSDFRNAVEEVLISEYGVSSMIKSLMEKSEGNEQDKENEFWMNQFDEGDDEYYEDLSDEEVADYFKDMEGFERELAKGTEHEMEHLDTLKKVAEGKLTPEEAVVETAKTHIAENPEYYEDLAKMEEVSDGVEISKNVDNKLKELGFEFNKFNYRYGKEINEQDYITAFYSKKENLYKIRGTHKFTTPLGENSVGIQFDFNNEKEFYNKIQEYLSKSIKMGKQPKQEVVEEESMPELIEGLKVLANSLEGAEKKEIEDVIEGLEILLESDNKFEKGGELDNNSMFFEPSKADQEEEKRIMENQFGKNI